VLGSNLPQPVPEQNGNAFRLGSSLPLLGAPMFFLAKLEITAAEGAPEGEAPRLPS